MTRPVGSEEVQEKSALPGAQLAPNPEEVNLFHRYSDSDVAPESQHHTLGIEPNQASPGDHNHDGRNSYLVSGSGSTSEFGGELLGWGSTAPIVVTTTTPRFKVTVNLEFTSTQSGGMTVTTTGHNSAVMNGNVMTLGGSGVAAGRAISTSQTKYFNCDVGDVVTVTPGGFSGTINQIEIYVESVV